MREIANFKKAIKLIISGNPDGAEPILKSFCKESPLYLPAQVNLALLYSNDGRLIEAESICSGLYHSADDILRNDQGLFFTYVKTYFEIIIKQHRVDEASAILQKGLDAIDTCMLDATLCTKIANFLNSAATAFIEIRPDLELSLLNDAEEYALHESVPQTISSIYNNRGCCYISLQDFNSAITAFTQAIEIAIQHNLDDELHRAKVGLAQSQGSSLQREHVLQVLDAVKYARNQGEYLSALRRACIALMLTERLNDKYLYEPIIDIILRISDENEEITRERNRALYFAGIILRKQLHDTERAMTALSKAVQGFLLTTIRTRHEPDKANVMVDGHYCFRELAHLLIQQDRIEEACFIIELARFFGWAFSFSKDISESIVSTNPLKEVPEKFNTELLLRLMETISDGEVHLHLAFLPPDLACFLVRNNGISVVLHPVPNDSLTFIDDIYSVPENLDDGLGMSSIPSAIISMTDKIVAAIDSDIVTRLVPYAALHLIPWREILNATGINHTKMQMPIAFSGLSHPKYHSVSLDDVMILASGDEENDTGIAAHIFADVICGGSIKTLACADDLTRALECNRIVLVCSHALPSDNLADTILILDDGPVLGLDVIPECVSAEMVILMNCDSATYMYSEGEVLSGLIPALLAKGCHNIIGNRFPVEINIAKRFLELFGGYLHKEYSIEDAFSNAKENLVSEGYGIWNTACLELFCR